MAIPDPHYLLIDTARDDMPAVVVVNDSALSLFGREVFPWHLEISIDARKTAKNGMPTPAERIVLDRVGDALECRLDDSRTSLGSSNALFLARVTWNSRRELVYRVHDPEVANAILQRAVVELTEREWEFTMASDERWEEVEAYQSLVASCKD
jgi:hypothetical protein